MARRNKTAVNVSTEATQMGYHPRYDLTMSQRNTGIFLPYFKGQRLRDFPQALDSILNSENVHYYDGVYHINDTSNYVQLVTNETLLKVHSKEMIEAVKRTGYFDTALYSAGGTVQAAQEILRGTIDNAFVFTGVGDHHAGKCFFWGMCYFNGAALAIAELREKGIKRFAIVDTDSHHADGTRDIFNHDKQVIHICFCSESYCDDKNNVDVNIPFYTNDEDYLQKVEVEMLPRIKHFKPELIFWEFGYDATQGEYGDRGLTADCHLEIAKLIKSAADAICQGKLITILCGGSGRKIATYIIPKIIAHMAETR
ncbi:MAG: histone deacetylase [Chloroflexi bacterium]|nr:histone deacetylase [Chloroflexota bacterium]MBM3173495.1 histone deacetylase [Chloroflexota bacterium]MBM3174524.1 histone deacetylase [Chloroflexota bacterium]MBM4450525.1 histone deacetylase [Chloroflexota bacterium]